MCVAHEQYCAGVFREPLTDAFETQKWISCSLIGAIVVVFMVKFECFVIIDTKIEKGKMQVQQQ